MAGEVGSSSETLLSEPEPEKELAEGEIMDNLANKSVGGEIVDGVVNKMLGNVVDGEAEEVQGKTGDMVV